jgi:acyl-CoA dehydrogenase
MNALATDSTTASGRVPYASEEIAATFAHDVDRDARFPFEAVDALRAERALSFLVPVECGGDGASLSELVDVTLALSSGCASTGMIFAMHQLQVACIARHARSTELRGYLQEIADRQLLLASATSEQGVGGDIRSSICAIERADGSDRYHLEKLATVISYGEHADGVLATARRCADSPPSDQVLVVCRPPDLSLETTSGWDTLGFRGTCSPGFRLVAEGELGLVLDDPFGEIAAQTMLPVSHVLWSSVWLGIAAAAVERARTYVQSEARKKPGVTPPGATRLAELSVIHQQMSEMVRGAARRYDEKCADPDALSSMGFAIAMNNVKLSASTLVVDIVGRALAICGIAGYREDTPYSMGRLLRDAYGAALMVNNDRIIGNNAQMLLIAKETS